MTQILYYWDEFQHLEHSELYMDEADLPITLPTNATTIAPKNGLYEPISWNGSAWVGTTKTDWLAAHPVLASEPTDQDKTNASVMLQIAINKATQDQFNSQLLLQTASINGGVK